MKKIYLSVLSLAIVTGLNAQVTGNFPQAPKKSTFSSNQASSYTPNFEKVLIWQNDVSVAADWTFTNTSAPNYDWYRETVAANVPSDGPVAFATASGGFLMIDSDGQGNTATQDAYATYTGTFDLTGQTAVTLEFAQHYRTYGDERYVDLSFDGGMTWPTTYTITDGTEAGGTVLSGTGSIDISAAAGNQANVTIRFHYVGNWGWHWAVDDISVKTTEPYDLSADNNFWGVDGSWGPRLPYYRTPTAQIQPINFCGVASNIGLNPINDATYGVAIPSAGFVGTGSTSLAVGASDTICSATTFTPAAAGAFVASGVMTTSNPDTGTNNNAFPNIIFEAGGFIYARDKVGLNEGGTYNAGDGYDTGNIFDMFANATLTGIDVAINAASVAGAEVYVSLWTIDPATGDFILEDQSVAMALTAGQLGTTVTLPLAGGAYNLLAGESYLITAGSFGDGGLTNDLVITTAGNSEAQTTFYFDQTDQTWYYSSSTKGVRMNFTPAGLDEVSNVNGMNVFPNPTNADANVSFTLNNAADVNITVTDLTGKVVYTNNLGNVSAGKSEVSLNTAALSNGMYIVNVAADNAVSTQKLAIRK